MVRFARSWPRAAQIELVTAAAWVVLGLVGGIWWASDAPWWARLGTILAGVLLALPFLAVGVILVGRSRSRRLTGLVLALILAIVCLGVAISGSVGELLRGSTAAEFFDRVGGAVIVFGLSGIVHAISGVIGFRSRSHVRSSAHPGPPETA